MFHLTTRAWVAVLKAPRSFAIACPCPAVSPSAHSPPLSTQIFLLVVQLNPCSTVFCRERGRAGKSGVEEGRAGKEGGRGGHERAHEESKERTHRTHIRQQVQTQPNTMAQGKFRVSGQIRCARHVECTTFPPYNVNSECTCHTWPLYRSAHSRGGHPLLRFASLCSHRSPRSHHPHRPASPCSTPCG